MSPIFFVFLFDVIPGFSIYSTTVFSFSFPLFEEIPSPASGQNIHLNVFFFFLFSFKRRGSDDILCAGKTNARNRD